MEWKKQDPWISSDAILHGFSSAAGVHYGYDGAALFRFVTGRLGILLCVAGCLGVWYVESRIDLARERIFERIDQSLSGINGRLDETQELAEKLKLDVTEIEQHMRDWSTNVAKDRVVERFEVEQRAQQLTAGLQQAELMLDLSREMVESVRQALEMGADVGLSTKAEIVDPLLERIASITESLSDAGKTVEILAQQIGEGRDGELRAERSEQAATITARLLATFVDVDSRIAGFRDRLTEAQDAIKQLNAVTHTRIIAAAVCGTLCLLWMGAGQFCLWRWARNR